MKGGENYGSLFVNKSSDGAFQAWLRAKAKQRRDERKRDHYERGEIYQVKNAHYTCLYLFVS